MLLILLNLFKLSSYSKNESSSSYFLVLRDGMSKIWELSWATDIFYSKFYVSNLFAFSELSSDISFYAEL
jgi:hypothetical protein